MKIEYLQALPVILSIMGNVFGKKGIREIIKADPQQAAKILELENTISLIKNTEWQLKEELKKQAEEIDNNIKKYEDKILNISSKYEKWYSKSTHCNK